MNPSCKNCDVEPCLYGIDYSGTHGIIRLLKVVLYYPVCNHDIFFKMIYINSI